MADNELSDSAIVIRGGTNARKVVQQQAEDEFEASGIYAISVGADEKLSLDDLAMANKRPNSVIRKSLVGRLRAAGFEVTPPKGKKRHANLILPSPPTDTDWERLDMAFDPPEPNPYTKQGGAK